MISIFLIYIVSSLTKIIFAHQTVLLSKMSSSPVSKIFDEEMNVQSPNDNNISKIQNTPDNNEVNMSKDSLSPFTTEACNTAVTAKCINEGCLKMFGTTSYTIRESSSSINQHYIATGMCNTCKNKNKSVNSSIVSEKTKLSKSEESSVTTISNNSTYKTRNSIKIDNSEILTKDNSDYYKITIKTIGNGSLKTAFGSKVYGEEVRNALCQVREKCSVDIIEGIDFAALTDYGGGVLCPCTFVSSTKSITILCFQVDMQGAVFYLYLDYNTKKVLKGKDSLINLANHFPKNSIGEIDRTSEYSIEDFLEFSQCLLEFLYEKKYLKNPVSEQISALENEILLLKNQAKTTLSASTLATNNALKRQKNDLQALATADMTKASTAEESLKTKLKISIAENKSLKKEVASLENKIRDLEESSTKVTESPDISPPKKRGKTSKDESQPQQQIHQIKSQQLQQQQLQQLQQQQSQIDQLLQIQAFNNNNNNIHQLYAPMQSQPIQNTLSFLNQSQPQYSSQLQASFPAQTQQYAPYQPQQQSNFSNQSQLFFSNQLQQSQFNTQPQQQQQQQQQYNNHDQQMIYRN